MRYILFAITVLFANNIIAQKITKEELKEHVAYLASDELEGRKPGTEGDTKSAEYIKKHFKDAGLQLMGEDGFQYFDVVTGIKLKEGNHLYINNFHAKSQEDNIPFPFSGNGKVEAEVVFVGYGFHIDEEAFKWNDYEGMNVKDKWVLVLRGDPEMRNRQSKFIPYSSDRSKVRTALKYGAAGILFVSGESFDPKDELVELKYGRGNAQVDIPVINIIRPLADMILKDKKLKELEKKLNNDRSSNSFQTGSKVTGIVNIEYVKTRTHNVIAMLPGNNKNLSKEYVVIGGHYDHLGFGGRNSGSRMPDTLAVHNGADDNASGIASILEIAQQFKNKKYKPERSILFMAFGAEEMGLLGSAFFVNNPLVDLNKIYAMINLDMVGKLNEKKTVTISGTGTAKELENYLDGIKQESKLNFAYSPGGYGASDHSQFYMNEIPVLFFNTGAHQDYHTPYDDIETLNYEGQEEVTKLIFKVLNDLSNSTESLTYQSTGNPGNSRSMSRGFKVTLGIMPGFGDTENKGLRVDGTRKDGPADTGGIKRGDVITAINGEKIANIYEYMDILGKLEAGQRIMVDVVRDGEKVVLAVQL